MGSVRNLSESCRKCGAAANEPCKHSKAPKELGGDRELAIEALISNSPVFFCTERGGQFVFKCPFCKRLHKHGPVEGYRSSHCDAFEDGYYVLKASFYD